jgi:Flp pilus assembly protein TadD
MIRRFNGRHVWLPVAACLTVLAFALPATAQTGIVKGTVKDAKGQPVEGAKVTLEFTGGMNAHAEVTTNKKGEFVRVGVQLGTYKVTASKDGVGSQQLQTRVMMGNPTTLDFVLSAGAGGGAAPPTKEELAKNAALTKTFEEGVAASKAGNTDEAITKFTESTTLNPKCADCFYNLGFAYSQKKEYDKAVEAYKGAIEAKPNYADAYNGLASAYNAQHKFEEASAASAKASELSSTIGTGAGAAGGGATGGNVNSMYNQGVILWNGGKFAEAKKQFEAVIKADPNHAEAHYQLGMTLVNEGKVAESVPEFETYLKLTPEGPNAATAKAIVAQYKK